MCLFLEYKASVTGQAQAQDEHGWLYQVNRIAGNTLSQLGASVEKHMSIVSVCSYTSCIIHQ